MLIFASLTRVGDLEENVLHDVAAVRALELEGLAAEVDVVEAPGGSRQNGGQTLLALKNLQDKVDSGLAGITGSPRLAGHGVRGVPVCAHGLAVNKGLGDSITSLLLVKTHHLGDNGSRGKLDENDVVESDLVEGVLKSHAALDLVGSDHSLQNVTDLEDLSVSKVSAVLVCAINPVGGRKDGTQIVGRVTPLSSKPAVVEVQPADHSTDVEGSVDGVKLEVCTRNLCAVGDNCALNSRTKNVPALLELQALETTAQSVNEDPSCCVVLENRELALTFRV